jgi:heme/copper-type cytochrome/quinol oxidase subunit 4
MSIGNYWFGWNTFFQMALIYNLSLLLVSKFFTNSKLQEAYPEVFSKFSQVIIVLFGFIYYFGGISSRSKELFLVFAIVKVLYFLTGIYWIFYRSHTIKFQSHPIEWLFMRLYGFGDLAFGVYFYIYSTSL